MGASNHLLSTHQSSESGLNILLHPLVLLTISDYTTRHTLRNQTGPIIGALFGQQNGRDISLEHAFECKVVEKDGVILLDETWFGDRVKQFKDVHMAPPLDLFGWFALSPSSGPTDVHVAVHKQIQDLYPESAAVFLAFHPNEVGSGKLPLAMYEGVYEVVESEGMQDEGEDPLKLRFRELPVEIETGEAEMIGVDFVARGGGNATAVPVVEEKKEDKSKEKEKGEGGSKKDEAHTNEGLDVTLSPEDEEMIAALTAKVNAIRMLQSRLDLLTTYLTSIEPSYLTQAHPPGSKSPKSTKAIPTNHEILRSIQSLTKRLPLVIPSDRAGFESELLAERNDVGLVALLGGLSRSVRDVKELGRKFAVVENWKNSKGRKDEIGETGLGMGIFKGA